LFTGTTLGVLVAENEALAVKLWLDEFARASESSGALDHLVDVIDDQIVASLPEFLDPTLRAELHASTRSHWKGFLAVVTRDTIEVQPAPQVYDLARTLARRGFELPLLLSVYRIAQRATWQFITATLQTEVSDPAVRSAVLMQFWSHAAHWLDTTVESLIVMFTEERERWQRGNLARRAALVSSIVAGQVVDVDTAIATLAYPLRQNHTAFTLRVADSVPDIDVQRLLESSARSMVTAVGGSRPLMISSGARAAWCWTSTPGLIQPVPTTPPRLPRFVYATVGTCQNGIDGFRLSHIEAVAALSVTEGDDQPDKPLVLFQDVELACLATGILGAEARAAFVRRELAGLAAADESANRLRETLRIYLRRGGDAAVTGELLQLHPNTVRYRVRQAEKLLGHSVQQRRVQIELALEIIGVVGRHP
jgi:DNA-binding PucR family transcriptional regulator